MQYLVPIDAEDALRAELQEHTALTVLVPPLPKELPAKSVCVTVTNGKRSDRVADMFVVSVDVRGPEIADALEDARELAGIVSALESTELNTNPYINPDTRRPDIARVSFTALYYARAEVKKG